MGNQTNGMLFVASDIGVNDEAEFNDWYDHEHVEERARIQGFISSARYQSVNGRKRYLGLYRTQSLEAFTSDAYKAAFGKQTQWSVTNLNRMIDPMRRVSAVESVVGQGSGSWISVVFLGACNDEPSLKAQATALGHCLSKQPGVIQSYLLIPNPTLSSPLPAERVEGRQMLPIFVVEATNSDAIEIATKAASEEFGSAVISQTTYSLLWKLYAAELA